MSHNQNHDHHLNDPYQGHGCDYHIGEHIGQLFNHIFVIHYQYMNHDLCDNDRHYHCHDHDHDHDRDHHIGEYIGQLFNLTSSPSSGDKSNHQRPFPDLSGKMTKVEISKCVKTVENVEIVYINQSI